MSVQTPRLWPIVLAVNCVLVALILAVFAFLYAGTDVLMTQSKVRLLFETYVVVALLLSTGLVLGAGLFGLFRSVFFMQRNSRAPGLSNIANQLGIGIVVPTLLNDSGRRSRSSFIHSLRITIIGVALLLLTAFIVLNTEFGHMGLQPNKKMESDA